MSAGSLHSSGEWLIPPAPLRTKSIPQRTPAASTPRVVTGPGDELGRWQAAPLELLPQHGLHSLVHACRLGEQRRVEADRRDERIEPFPVGCSRVDAEDRALGDHVRRTRHNFQSTHGRDALRDGDGGIADPEDELGRCAQRVAPAVHRRRARVSRRTPHDDLAVGGAHDAGNHA